MHAIVREVYQKEKLDPVQWRDKLCNKDVNRKSVLSENLLESY